MTHTYSNEQLREYILDIIRDGKKAGYAPYRPSQLEKTRQGHADKIMKVISDATKAAETRGKLWGIDLAFDCHDYDRIRKVKAELKSQLPEEGKDK